MSQTAFDQARQRLVFPLDYPTLDEARRGAEAVAEHVGVLKVGLELFVKEGPRAVALGEQLGCQVFLDLKLHDIPATVERAVASAISLGAHYLTVHASGGREMLEQASKRVQAEGSALTLLAVTVLTSLDQTDLELCGVSATPLEQAVRLGRLAQNAGIPGLVTSVAEVGALREALGRELVLVTPGIRLADSASQDQKRVGTPRAAIAAGSSLLVVGRPIRDAADPKAAALQVRQEIASALG